MNKKELLIQFNANDLADISDKNLINLAIIGKFGRNTQSSACKSWAFDSEHDLAEHIRTALEKGKQLRTCITEGEHYCPDKIEIDYV